ncbi:MAG: SUMF1/EgtB/PvdO family nonheme iron enzyme [Leptospiraceae bacterium]|nr:SUMF1/EgtB/PvdO family nonheme iron enzyme [Leptospiraceae bacterium]MCP5486662.1 SUMF1/EgtB/PvdO family nonheme iron enzyme [Spirochaetales bacterium]
MVPMLEWVGARKYGGLRHGYRVSIVLSARRACRLHSLLPGTLLAISGLVFFFGACSNQLRVPPEPWQREATQSVATEPIDSVAMVHSARSVFRIDRFEVSEASGDYLSSPNVLPRAMVTQSEAAAHCASRGKRLCSLYEWTQACLGPHGSRYAYGSEALPRACNTQSREAGFAGEYGHCRTEDGVFDMVGNLMEWVADERSGLAVAVGGSYRSGASASCFSTYYAPPQARSFQIGFRCCLGAPVSAGSEP